MLLEKLKLNNIANLLRCMPEVRVDKLQGKGNRNKTLPSNCKAVRQTNPHKPNNFMNNIK